MILKSHLRLSELVLIGRIDVIAIEPIYLEIDSLRDSTKTQLSPNQLGLLTEGNDVSIKSDIVLSALDGVQFPIRGFLNITDGRKTCVSDRNITSAGPCTTTIEFTIDIVEAFEPACPTDMTEWSSNGEAVNVTWLAPGLRSLNGTMYALRANIEPSSLFPLGRWAVSYQLPNQDSYQHPQSRPSCDFFVR